MSSTISQHAHSTDQVERATRVPYLVVALQCHRPLAPLARVGLARTETVTLGRGDSCAVERSGREVRIGVTDGRMSERHACLVRADRQWFVEDVGSKNGTMVNGSAITRRHALSDGDVIETGRTFFLYREQTGSGDSVEDIDFSASGDAPDAFVTFSPALRREFERLALVAMGRSPILITGDTGTGKELTADAIHRASGRAGRMVPVNCGGLPDTLVESLFFGARKGAYSGADRNQEGYVQAADRGTLFLDELGDLPEASQAVLLRCLQEGTVVPLGSTTPISVNVRFVSATNKDLRAMIAAGRFREDLYARLSGFRVHLPRLADRREDLGLLLAHTLLKIDPQRAPELQLSRSVARALLRYEWPLNIRELYEVMRAAVALVPPTANEIALEHLPDEIADVLQRPVLQERIDPSDDARLKEQLVELFREHGGNLSRVAREVGKANMQVRRWCKRVGIDPDDFRR